VDEATIQTLSVGDRANVFPGSIDRRRDIGLPIDIDGVLDPTRRFRPWAMSSIFHV
jgi:hypothetical protein